MGRSTSRRRCSNWACCPAVDVGKSVSRVGGKAQRAAYRAVAGDLKLAYAQFEELETFARFGARLDEDTRKIIEHGRRIRACLKQPEFAPVSVPAQIAVLLALTAELFDHVPLDRMTDAEQAVRKAAAEIPAEVRERLDTADKLSDEDRETIIEIARTALAALPTRAGIRGQAMSDTTASLRRKINSAGDLQSVVRTMKALAASSIGQYEQSVRALGDYDGTVELGLAVCFRGTGSAAWMTGETRPTEAGAIGAVVFGSDQGLVGQFNDVVADEAVQTLATLPAQAEVWAVGERVHARLADAGLPLLGLFAVPNSVQAITPLVGQILVETETRRSQGHVSELHLFYNRPMSAAVYAPVHQRLLPLDERWRLELERTSLADEKPARGPGWRHRDLAGARPRIPFRLALPGVRRIARQREREPPGGDATRRQEHRRTAGGPERDVPPFAPEWHRRGTVRRHLRLRSAERGGSQQLDAELALLYFPLSGVR